jgi:predicted GNAT family acetyltransferase
VKERLVAVAGVHIVSEVDRLAALGNIVTHPEHRGQGLSTACTAHLAQRLLGEGIDVLALNVVRANASAVRVYEKLGFRENNTYLEGFLTRPLNYRTPRT